ncbi:MAG: hypothetical protein M1827_004887 [Pycnora praestabilis]|nr:MAG: hypothetical protein M1827_004887 [Pycnora praestabilis]
MAVVPRHELVQPLHEDLSHVIPSSTSSHNSLSSHNLASPPPAPSAPPQAANSSPLPDDHGETLSEAEPPIGQQRVFDVAPLNTMGTPRKVAIAIFIIASNLVPMISLNIGVGGGLQISRALGVERPGQANWIAASYPLTLGTFVLVSGRLGAVYGHKYVLHVGGVWFVVFTIINGFCNDYIAFNAARALTGIGGALILPNAVALIGITVPPGKMRNLSLGLFGASGPVGGFIGAVFSGLIIKYTDWKWIFFFLALIAVWVFGNLWALLPHETPVDRQGKIDWIGATLGTSGLIIFNAAWNQAPTVGWSNPYEVALLLVAVALFGVFTLWEAKYAHTPIMPLNIWRAPSFALVILSVLLTFMSFGIMLWYMALWQQVIRHWSALSLGIGWAPGGIGGALAASLAAWLIPRLAAQWILALGTTAVLLSNIILVTMPEQQTYWAQMFPATMLFSLCPDLTFTAAQIIASNSVPRSQQGIAASLVATLNLYGQSLGLGFAGTVESEVNGHGLDTVKGYRGALYLAIGLAVAALVIELLFVRMARDEREGWEDEGDNLNTNTLEPQASTTGTELRSMPPSQS